MFPKKNKQIVTFKISKQNFAVHLKSQYHQEIKQTSSSTQIIYANKLFLIRKIFQAHYTHTPDPNTENSFLNYSSINGKTNRKQLFLICLFFFEMSSEITEEKYENIQEHT